MWRRSFISRRVLFASILLSKALPIFLMATSSRVSEFTAALKETKHTLTRRWSQMNRSFTVNTQSGWNPCHTTNTWIIFSQIELFRCKNNYQLGLLPILHFLEEKWGFNTLVSQNPCFTSLFVSKPVWFYCPIPANTQAQKYNCSTGDLAGQGLTFEAWNNHFPGKAWNRNERRHIIHTLPPPTAQTPRSA